MTLKKTLKNTGEILTLRSKSYCHFGWKKKNEVQNTLCYKAALNAVKTILWTG